LAEAHPVEIGAGTVVDEAREEEAEVLVDWVDDALDAEDVARDDETGTEEEARVDETRLEVGWDLLEDDVVVDEDSIDEVDRTEEVDLVEVKEVRPVEDAVPEAGMAVGCLDVIIELLVVDQYAWDKLDAELEILAGSIAVVVAPQPKPIHIPKLIPARSSSSTGCFQDFNQLYPYGHPDSSSYSLLRQLDYQLSIRTRSSGR
jgi:hypothetical protein